MQREESDAVKALRRKITRRRFLEVLSVGGGLLVARCAPAPGPTPTPIPPLATPGVTATPLPPAPTQAPAAEPQWLIVASAEDIDTLDPRDRGGNDHMMRQLYDSLFYQKGWPPELTPSICKSYESSDDVREWVFHLDDRAVFHDGTPVTAQAVEWTLKSVLEFQRVRAANLMPVMNKDSIEVVDNHTLRIVLTTPFADLPWLLGYAGWIFIGNPEQIMAHEANGDKGEGWLREHEAGSGPFVVNRWEPGTVYEVEAVPDYWRGWPPEGRLAGAYWRIIRETAERRIALMAGEVDVALYLTAEDFQLINDNPGTHMEVHPGFWGCYVKLNNQVEPFSDVNFRKFLAYAFDYEGFQATQGGAELCPLMVGPLPEGVPGHDADVEPVYRQDLDEARRYLDMTPWGDGGIEFDYVYVTGSEWGEAAGMMLAEPLAEFGIAVNLVPKVWPDMVALSTHPESGMETMITCDDQGPIATQWMRYEYYSKFWDKPEGGSYQSAAFYKNPELDALLEQAEVTADLEARMKLVRDMQTIVMEDSPAIMAFNLANMAGFSNRVKGFEYTGYFDLDLWPLWIEEA